MSTVPTTQEQLDAVNQAIYDLTTGGLSQTSVLGQQYTKATLDQLISWRTRLMGEIASVADGGSEIGGGFVNVGIGDPYGRNPC